MTTQELNALAEYNERQCNRYVNGFCSTHRCMKRGGFVAGGDMNVATCEEHEIAQALRTAATSQASVKAMREALELSLQLRATLHEAWFSSSENDSSANSAATEASAIENTIRAAIDNLDVQAGVALTDIQIKHMVDRFLGWNLPDDFLPDCGISFKRTHSEQSKWGPQKYEPTGTNLFDAIQATEMVRYMVEGLPAQQAVDAEAVAKELPDGIRIPLHELQADVAYLIGRVLEDASCASMVVETFTSKLALVEAALKIANDRKCRSTPTGVFADPRDGIMLRFDNRVRRITNAERKLIVAVLALIGGR